MAKIKTVKKTGKAKLNKLDTGTIKKILKKEKVKEKIKLVKQRLSPVKTQQTTNQKVNLEQVRTAIESLFKLTKDKVPKKLFDDEYPIFLQVTAIKIPECADRRLRLLLKHNLLTDTSEICLVVSDLKRGRRVDYNPTIEHYEDILKKNDIKNIKRIIPLNCIKVEYDQFELKRNLVAQYDAFLADGKICGHLSHFLGKAFYNSRKMPTPVSFEKPNLKDSIEKALCKTAMRIHSKGNTFIVQIGHSKMSIDHMVENIYAVEESLTKDFPGGWDNIRSLQVKTHLSMAIPVYMTLKSSNIVNTPKIKSIRPKSCRVVSDELSTKLNANVIVLPSGNVIVHQNVEKQKKRLKKK